MYDDRVPYRLGAQGVAWEVGEETSTRNLQREK